MLFFENILLFFTTKLDFLLCSNYDGRIIRRQQISSIIIFVHHTNTIDYTFNCFSSSALKKMILLYFLHLLSYNKWIAFSYFLCAQLLIVEVALVFITVTMHWAEETTTTTCKTWKVLFVKIRNPSAEYAEYSAL